MVAAYDNHFGMGQQPLEGDLGAAPPSQDPGDVVMNPGPIALRHDAYLQTENSPNDSVLGAPQKFGQKRLGYRK